MMRCRPLSERWQLDVGALTNLQRLAVLGRLASVVQGVGVLPRLAALTLEP